MTNQPPYQQPQYPQEPQYAPPEDPFTEPPTPPPYADATNDASYIQQSQHLPAPQPYPSQQFPAQPYPAQPHPSQQFPVPQQYQPAPPFNPALVAPPALLQQQNRPVWPWVLTGAAVLVVALVVGAIALIPSSSDDNTNNDGNNVVDPTPTATAVVPTTGKMGDPVLDGKLAFTVKSMKCGQTQIGKPSSQYDFTRKAEYQFCIIDMNVKNTGDDSVYFSSFGFKVTGKSGASVTDDLLAEDAVATDEGKKFDMFWTLDANQDVEFKLVFDTPAAKEPASIVVRQSLTGTGATIPLTPSK